MSKNVTLQDKNGVQLFPATTADQVAYKVSNLKQILDSNPINVLTLGVKNDGSEDCSAIINQYTESYALYFPVGQYLVNDPIVLKNPIYGEEFSRYNVADDSHTWFISGINTTDNTVALFSYNASKQITISNINIKLNSSEAGIRIVNTTKYTYLENINISNVKSYGIYVENTTSSFASRLVHFDTISVFGNASYPVGSTGIKITGNVGDSRVTNIEIMGTQIGLDVNQGILYGSDLHIWTGCMAGSDSNGWWTNTIGLYVRAGGRVFLDNLYLDTCHYPIAVLGNQTIVEVNKIIYTEDSTTQGNTTYNSCLIYSNSNDARVKVNGGMVTFKGDASNPCQLARMTSGLFPNIRLNGITLISDYPATYVNRLKYTGTQMGNSNAIIYNLPITTRTDAKQYIEIARFMHNQYIRGTADITLTGYLGDYGHILIEKTTNTNDYHFTLTKGTKDYYTYHYKVDTTNGTLIIYLGVPTTSSAGTNYIRVINTLQTIYFMGIDYGNIRRLTAQDGSYEYPREVLTSDNGLTQITV